MERRCKEGKVMMLTKKPIVYEVQTNLQGGEVHEVRQVGVAGDGLGGQVDLQGSLLFPNKHLVLESFIS